MKKIIIADLSSQIDALIVKDLIESYEELLSKHRSGDLQGALTKAGRFVEHTLRAIEYVRTGTVISEIKSVQQAVQRLENETKLPESLRLLIPRAAYGLVYNLRSKRNAVHVKEIDPTPIDVSLAVSAASWIAAELLRQFHRSDRLAVEQAMLALSRTAIPLIEAIDGEVFVGQKVPASKEILLLLAHSKPNGMTRKAIGDTAKCSQSSVTKSLKTLIDQRHAHFSTQGEYFITSTGERELACWIGAASDSARLT